MLLYSGKQFMQQQDLDFISLSLIWLRRSMMAKFQLSGKSSVLYQQELLARQLEIHAI